MFHVIDLRTGRVRKSYNTVGWARREVDRLVEKSKALGNCMTFTYENLAVMDDAEYNRRMDEINPMMVEVINMMSKKPVLIRKSDCGTCCDPSTEQYWSM